MRAVVLPYPCDLLRMGPGFGLGGVPPSVRSVGEQSCGQSRLVADGRDNPFSCLLVPRLRS